MSHQISNITEADKPAFWSYQFTEELYANGLRHVIISPGSRSTPLALAFDCHEGIQKTIVLDERSAAYTALGVAKSTGIPAALVCTSGTAAANYFPAVIEARQSETPLLVLTADRPPKQRFTGSSQTIDQIKLYGDYPLFFHDTGEPVLQDEDLGRLKFLACQAVRRSIDQGGPVHINFPFRKPLEPGEEFLSSLEKASKQQRQENLRPSVRTVPPSQEHIYLPDELTNLINKANRPLLIAGPRPYYHSGKEIIIEFAERLKAPLLSESSSQVNGSSHVLIKGFDSILRSVEIRDELKPDLIIRFGSEPVSRGIELLLKQYANIPHIHFFESDKPQNASLSLDYSSQLHLSALKTPRFVKRDGSYLKNWQFKSKHYIDRVHHYLDQQPQLTDPHVYFDLVPLIPGNWNVTLSNSFPVRDFDAFGLPKIANQPVFVNRGAAGIDGVTSTAIGCSLGNQNKGVLFTGDLAFLHDSNALLQSAERKQTCMIIVVNNSGGSIFRMLPFEKQDKRFTALFETPQQVNISSLVKAHNIDFLSVNKREDLKTAFMSLSEKQGFSVLECVTDPDNSMKIRKKLWE